MRTATGRPYLADRNPELFHQIEAILEAVDDALHHRAREMGLRVAQVEADKSAGGAWVHVRRALAGEIGQKEQALRAGRRLRRQRGQTFVVLATERIAPPPEGPASRESDPHQVIAARHRMAESVEPALGVDPRRRAVGEHHSAGADRRADQALAHDAVADRCRCVVARAGSHRTSGRGCRRRCHAARHVRAFEDLRQPRSWDLERGEDLVGPPAAV